MKKSILFLFIINFLLGFTIVSPTYKNLRDLEYVQFDVWQTKYSLPNIKYVFYGQKIDLKSKDVKSISYKVEAAILAYAKENKLPTKECRKMMNLEVYYVEEEVLNDKNRFPVFINDNLGPNDKVWGAYDPVLESSNYSVLILSNPGSSKTEETEAHELFHFWYDKLCWEKEIGGNHEDAAIKFEEFYEQKYLRG